MSATRSRRYGRLPRGLVLAAACLGIGAICAAQGTTSLYHEGYARQRAGEPMAQSRTGPAGRSAPWLGAAGSSAPSPNAVEVSQTQRSSLAKMMGASLLIPGWGQYLTGHKGRATAFLAAEVSLIATFIGFRVQGEVRQERYVAYAEQFAAVQDAGDKPDSYYRYLGRYMSVADFEDDLARDARARYGDDVERREAYVAARLPSADEAWEWESQAHRETYIDMRKGSRTSFHRADQVIGVILVNHLLSGIDAAWLSRKGSAGRALYVSPGPDGMSYVGLIWPLDE